MHLMLKTVNFTLYKRYNIFKIKKQTQKTATTNMHFPYDAGILFAPKYLLIPKRNERLCPHKNLQ